MMKSIKSICEDEELVGNVRELSMILCYPDPKLKTATIDVGFYLSRFSLKRRKLPKRKMGGSRRTIILILP
jgi:hypothetical protein